MFSFGAARPRSNSFARMGSGKTAVALRLIDYFRTFEEVKRCCIIGPKRVARSTWIEEGKFWEDFQHLKIGSAVGTLDQRIAAVKANPDILCINYESLPWLIDGYGDNWPFDMVIPDESIKLKGLRIGVRQTKTGKEYIQGQGTQRSHALANIAFKKVHHWLNLNGSPAPNGLQDLYGQCWFVDGGAALGRSFTDFENRWFNKFAGPDGYTMIRAHAHAAKEIQDRIRPFSITIDPRDYFPVGDVIESRVYVDLPPRARAAYKTMEKELFAQIADVLTGKMTWIEVFNAGGKVAKCLQIACGNVYHAEGEFVPVHDEKLQALESIVNEAFGESLLVRYLYKPDKERILKMFPGSALLDSDANIKRFQEGKLGMAVAHAASCGAGLSLHQNCRTLVDYGFDFDLYQDEQIIERIGPTRQAQAGSLRNVFRYRIVARDTIEDRVVLPRLEGKMSVQDAFLSAMKG